VVSDAKLPQAQVLLARTELGHYQVQGLDYAHTLQGWLKAVNHPTDPAQDPDGRPGPRGSFAPDAFGYALHYHNGDYQGIGWAGPSFALAPDRGLYNGNIAAMQTNIAGPGPQAMAYRYDQPNGRRPVRIRETRAHTWNGTAWAAQADRYRETFQYDPNGNITALARHNQAGGQIDNLTYNYLSPANNRLGSVANTASGGIANQNPGNYGYDPIGNLTRDASEGITAIDWTVYGKVAQVTKTGGGVQYWYDAAGQRVAKVAAGVLTWYVRDASGND
jgi:YD repeat-containing protein